MASKDKDKQENNVEEPKELPIIPVSDDPGYLSVYAARPSVPTAITLCYRGRASHRLSMKL